MNKHTPGPWDLQAWLQQPCSLCGDPIKNREPGQLTHGWCAISRQQVAASAPQPPRADVAVETAPARFPSATELPIEPVEGYSMPRAQKKVQEIQQTGPTIDQVVAIGTEYEALKTEADRIEGELKKKAEFLKKALPNFPDGRVRIGERDLALISLKPQETFDLKSALKVKKLGEYLAPYIETVRTLDLDSARKHLPEEMLEEYISRTPRATQLRFLKPGG
jgi:hypothetical protein